MMPTLGEVARYVRSKNAGPFWVTIDIFCETDDAFNRIRSSPHVTGKVVADLYGVAAEQVKVFYIEDLRVIKFSFPRPMPQGHKYENDMHAGQQYVRMMDIVL
jgi:hypothetical protein